MDPRLIHHESIVDPSWIHEVTVGKKNKMLAEDGYVCRYLRIVPLVFPKNYSKVHAKMKGTGRFWEITLKVAARYP